jgi:WD40 repeat protein
MGMETFPSADGQHARLVVGTSGGNVRVYDPEAGSVLHPLDGHIFMVRALACIASSSAAPHHPRVVSTSSDGLAKVWDGETGELLTDLIRQEGLVVTSVVVWKEHVGRHDRIATLSNGNLVKVWDGDAFTVLRELSFRGRGTAQRLLSFQSAEGPHCLVVKFGDLEGLEVWDPEEGRRLHDGISRGCLVSDCHLLESAEGRHLLVVASGWEHPRHPSVHHHQRLFLDVWDMGEAPARLGHLRPAHRLG